MTILATISQSLSGQTQTKMRIWIKSNDEIQKVYKLKGIKHNVAKGSEVESQYTKVGGGQTYTIKRTQIAPENYSILVDTTILVSMSPNAEGWANIRKDDKDPTTLHINYWLNPINVVRKGAELELTTRTMQFDKSFKDISSPRKKVDKKEVHYLYKVTADEYPVLSQTTWFKNAGTIIKVFKDSTAIVNYYLVNRWDGGSDYILKLENRHLLSMVQKSLEFGPLIIPIKYRFERIKNKIIAPDEFSTDLNVGVYGGYRIGKYRARYQAGDGIMELSPIGVSLGGFLNVGTASLDSLNTTLGRVPLKKEVKSTIGILSPGVGIMLSVYNLQIGLYTGVDCGFGNSARNWNYNNRGWVGFGIAYNVSGFWKK